MDEDNAEVNQKMKSNDVLTTTEVKIPAVASEGELQVWRTPGARSLRRTLKWLPRESQNSRSKTRRNNNGSGGSCVHLGLTERTYKFDCD